MSRNLFLLSGLTLVLLFAFGCAGSRGTTQTPPAQPSGQVQGSQNTGIQVGDSDISPQGEPNEDTLSTGDVVPPDNESATTNTTQSMNTTNQTANAASNLSDSDLVVINESPEDLISQVDVVEPS